MKTFFEYISNHYAAFYWAAWGYIAIVMLVSGILQLSEWISGVAIVPVNLITWPVFLAVVRQWRVIPFLVGRTAVALVLVSTSAFLWGV